MFEGLDEFDWMQFGPRDRLGRIADDIPQLLRDLASSDENTIYDAGAALFEHSGSVSSAMPKLIPFALEIMEIDDHPARGYLLSLFVNLMESRPRNREDLQQARLAIQIYDELLKGVPIYMMLLNASQPEVRAYAGLLLGYMQEHISLVVPALTVRYRQEPEAHVRDALVHAVGHIYNDIATVDLDSRTACRELLFDVLQSDEALETRYAAVRMADNRFMRGEDRERIYDTMIAICIERLVKAKASSSKVEAAMQLQQFPTAYLIKHLPEEVSAYEAFLIVSALLKSFHHDGEGFDYLYWHNHHAANQENQSLYTQPGLGAQVADRKLVHNALEAVINYERFWYYKTNLLGTFYGLPNNRPGLRRVLRKLIEAEGTALAVIEQPDD